MYRKIKDIDNLQYIDIEVLKRLIKIYGSKKIIDEIKILEKEWKNSTK